MQSQLSERDSTLYLRDMLEFCDRVTVYAAGHDLPALLADKMRYDAILRNLELIGEAASHVPAEIRACAPGIPWRQVIGTRNRLAHAYLGIEPETVWLMVTANVPSLSAQLASLLATLS